MKVCHTVICVFFLSALQDGNTGLVNAQITVFAGTEGGKVTVRCSSYLSQSRKFFCREPCQERDYVIVTGDTRAQRGRYSIERRIGEREFLVTITQLTKSDSGSYRCGSVTSFSSSVSHIRIIVIDAYLSGDRSEIKTLNKTSGGEITVQCSFSSSGTRKYFCREPCEEKDILVETTGVRVKRSRYSIEYVPGSPSGGSLFVNISQLNKADSGRYRCALDKFLSSDPFRRFELVVSDDTTSTSVPSASSPSAARPLSPTSSSASPETTQQSATTGDMLLYVGVTLAIMVVLLSLTLLIFCRRKSSKLQAPPEETEYASVAETNRVYEDVGEDRQSRSAPVEISSAYTSAKYTKTSSADASNAHSFVSAQNTAEDNSSKLTYSELNFSNRAASSGHDVLRGGDDNVIYSVPRVDDESPVYSTVT